LIGIAPRPVPVWKFCRAAEPGGEGDMAHGFSAPFDRDIVCEDERRKDGQKIDGCRGREL
jgi:hypothetical protein